mgnify:CR=1 FL=1
MNNKISGSTSSSRKFYGNYYSINYWGVKETIINKWFDLKNEKQNRLVVFDVEGVIMPRARFMLFRVVAEKGLRAFIKAVFFCFLYEAHLISMKRLLKNLYKTLEGVPLEKFLDHFQRTPLMPGVKEVFKELKECGFKIALISSSIPRIVLERLAERLEADFVSGLEVGLSEGKLNGEIWGDVMERGGKAIALRKILNNENSPFHYCIGVASDRDNIPLFQLCNLKIGYNPDFFLSRKSDYVVKGELSRIMPIIKGEPIESGVQIFSDSRILRKVIHIGGFSVPLICISIFNRYTVALLILLITMLYIISEMRKMTGRSTALISYITYKAAGKPEYQGFVMAPIFYALGIVASLIIFSEPVGYVAITTLTLGDGAASFFGQRFGRRRIPFNKDKSFEGTVCGFLFAFCGSLLFIDPLRALITSAIGMLAEVSPSPVNDNLTVPLLSGLTLTVLMAI